MKRHYSRYTPEMVERVCGIPKEKFVQVAKLYCENSGPEKTGTITYALNLTQHTNGVQNIRALCMLQILLGNIGRPGGGVVALRGHANVQGATDLELLYHELPGYLPMPLRDAHPDLKTYLEKVTPEGRLLGEPAEVHGQPAQGLLRRRRDGRERLRLPVAAQAGLGGRLQPPAHLRRHVQGRHQGLPRRRAESGGGRPERQAGPGRARQARLARGQGHLRHRDRGVLEGAGRGREGHQDRGVLPARRAGGREGRQPHQHHAADPVARAGGEAAGGRDLRRGVLREPRQAAAEDVRRAPRRSATRACWPPASSTATIRRSRTWSWC